MNSGSFKGGTGVKSREEYVNQYIFNATESQVAFERDFLHFFTSTTMTFLNPLVLFGLAAAAIPILLHLLNLRKLKTVQFSTLRFLHEIQRTRMRRIRLRQWILLVVRTLLILFLVLAFSRPTLKGSLAGLGSSTARSTIIILVDDSPSMGIRNTEGIIFDQARTTILQIAGLAKPGDDLHILRLSGSAAGDSSGTFWSAEGAIKTAHSMSLSNRSSRYDHLLRRALDIAEKSSTANREIYLLTDLQGTQFTTALEKADSSARTQQNVRVFVVAYDQMNLANAAVTSCTIESRILAQNRPMTINATVRNYGDQPMQNSVVSLYLDGTRVAQQTVDLASRGSAAVTLTAIPHRRGILGGRIRIEDDILEIDNSRYFAAAIPETIHVLLAGGVPEDTRYASLALTLSGDSSVAGLFQVTRIIDNQLAYADLQHYDAFVFAASRSLPPGFASRVASAVRQGKGLLFFPGPAMNVVEVNTGLLAAFGIPPITMPAIISGDKEPAGFTRFQSIDYSHPIFAGMFESDQIAGRSKPSIESPRIRYATTSGSGATGLTLVSLTDGRPFLREYQQGTGRVFVCAVDAGTEWSDFAVRGIFAPLLHRSILYLATPRQLREDAQVGDRLTFQILRSSDDFGREYVLVSPGGTEERVTPQNVPGTGALMFESAPTEEPGLYRLRYGGNGTGGDQTPLQAIAVHPDVLESDLRPASDEILAEFWKRQGIPDRALVRLDAGSSIVRAVEQSRHGVELWQLFLILAVGCALLEMIIARVSPATIPEETPHA